MALPVFVLLVLRLNELSTIAQALTWAADQLRAASATPRLDAELLLGHILGWERARVLAEGHALLVEPWRSAFRALIMRRAALEPVAYLIGHKEFYGLDFLVDRGVLVPRPETELLVDLALRYARGLPAQRPPVIADIGTGSGCIAVAVAVHLADALVYATDISPDALRIAGKNVERYGVAARVRLIQGNLLDALPEPVDLLLSNPPYTILSEIDEGVRRHEPHLALEGGLDGLDSYRRLLAAAAPALRPGGAVILEIGAAQGAAVSALALTHIPGARVSVHQDLAGLDRVVMIAMG
jgi:release factor glutamine methyltransferase